jgi:thiosulfate/3-mercaptopyruvate sulfurtransferase
VIAYAHPEVLVDTRWLSDHLYDPTVRIVEVDIAATAYDSGHIPGAVFWNAYTTLLQPDRRITADPAAVATLLARSGIANDTTVIVSSGHPAIAPWVFWYLKLFGHPEVRVLNGGHKKWSLEGRPLTTEQPAITPTHYTASPPDPSLRAFRAVVQASIGAPQRILVDVRTPQEYRGEWFMMKPPEGTERAGHIPGAVHLYYEETVKEDGTFRPRDELQALYRAKGVTPEKEALTYCAIGVRSAHTWFVLTYLLGYPYVRSYDGSWNEWGAICPTPRLRRSEANQQFYSAPFGVRTANPARRVSTRTLR